MWLLDQIRIRLFDKKDEEAQMDTLKTAKWPEDKGLILHALESRNGLLRAQAVSLLSWEEEREQLARLAKEDMDDVVRKIVARGNDAEIRSSKDGIKIFEVSKKVAAVIPAQPK